jgi:hypothetical protein
VYDVSAADAADRHGGHADPSVVRFRALLAAGLAALQERRTETNALNVLGVADGDTGDNMVLTLQAALDELDRLAEDSAGPEADELGRDEIVASVARAALLGARGSSGVILSQLIRGAAEELASRPGELIDPVLIGAALARAVDQAYGSVREPAEGTMLSVVREMAHRVASELAHRPDGRLAGEVTAAEQDFVIADLIESAVLTGQESVARGPERLAALRSAGVVDAGGFGLIVMVAGMMAELRGSEPPVPALRQSPVPESDPRHLSITYRYCTNFAVTGAALEPRRFAAELERIGDALLLVGDAHTLKVHLHTDQPERAQAAFATAGEVSHVHVFDMRRSIAERTAALRRP